MTQETPNYGASSHSAPAADSPTENATARKSTRIALVLDRSGSMQGIRSEALATFNEAIDRVRADAHKGAQAGLDTTLSVVVFNQDVKDALVNVAAAEVRRLRSDEYVPAGMTALYDGVGRAIDLLEDGGPMGEADASLVIVISDGHENSSRRVTQSDLVERMQALESTEQWTFSFLMANVDVTDLSRQMRTEASNFDAWDASPDGMKVCRDALRTGVGEYLEDRTMGVRQKKDFFKKRASRTS
jgi:uncharacterized protein YegL